MLKCPKAGSLPEGDSTLDGLAFRQMGPFYVFVEPEGKRQEEEHVRFNTVEKNGESTDSDCGLQVNSGLEKPAISNSGYSGAFCGGVDAVLK